MYGKQTRCAIAAMSRLAQLYDGGQTRVSAAEIAESRDLPQPFVAKILSSLSQAGLVTGSRGPGGGFSLARDPDEIRLYDVFRLFEREGEDQECPLGGGACGISPPCPLHDKFSSLRESLADILHETTFSVFCNRDTA